MTISKTERGFQIIHFKDINGKECSLQQSSIAIFKEPGTGAIWFGVGHERMHLDLPLMKELLPYLKKWVKTGHF